MNHGIHVNFKKTTNVCWTANVCWTYYLWYFDPWRWIISSTQNFSRRRRIEASNNIQVSRLKEFQTLFWMLAWRQFYSESPHEGNIFWKSAWRQLSFWKLHEWNSVHIMKTLTWSYEGNNTGIEGVISTRSESLMVLFLLFQENDNKSHYEQGHIEPRIWGIFYFCFF